METLKLIIELLKVIIWPTVALIVVWKFRQQILALIPNLREAKFAGAEFRWEQKMEAKIEAKIEEVNERLTEATNTKEIESLPMRITQFKTDDTVMLAFATGKSWEENIKYDIYYDPVGRKNHTAFSYVGLYRDQSIEYVGKITKIFCCDYENGKLVPTNGDDLSMLSDGEYQRIKNTIETAHYDIEEGHKFYLVDNFQKTRFVKTTPYGIMSKKYFWLDEYEGFKHNMSAQEMAAFLTGKTWA